MREKNCKIKLHLLATVFLYMACLAGCGKNEEPEYYEIHSEQVPFYDVASANGDVYASFLNMQFYQDEPVQIWAVYDGAGHVNAYLYKMDGSRELLLEDIPKEYGSGYV